MGPSIGLNNRFCRFSQIPAQDRPEVRVSTDREGRAGRLGRREQAIRTPNARQTDGVKSSNYGVRKCLVWEEGLSDRRSPSKTKTNCLRGRDGERRTENSRPKTLPGRREPVPPVRGYGFGRTASWRRRSQFLFSASAPTTLRALPGGRRPRAFLGRTDCIHGRNCGASVSWG